MNERNLTVSKAFWEQVIAFFFFVTREHVNLRGTRRLRAGSVHIRANKNFHTQTYTDGQINRRRVDLIRMILVHQNKES
jgi:hypothetical protein